MSDGGTGACLPMPSCTKSIAPSELPSAVYSKSNLSLQSSVPPQRLRQTLLAVSRRRKLARRTYTPYRVRMQFPAAHHRPCLGNVCLAASGLLFVLTLGSPDMRAAQPPPPVPVQDGTDCSADTLAGAKADLALAYKLEKKGQAEQALRVLNNDARALARCSLQARVYTQIGRLQLQLGDCQAARNSSQEALRLNALAPTLSCEEVGLDFF